MQAEGANGGGRPSEQTSDSEDWRFAVAMRKMMKKEIQVMMIHTIPQVMRPLMEDIVRNVVKEEIPLAMEKYLTGGFRAHPNTAAVSNERCLHLKFLDEVSEEVLTGKEIKGKGGTPIRVSIFDKLSRQVIDNGPESSSKVEILVLESNGNDNEHNWSHEDFNHRIIKESDKTKPHFAKTYYVYLEKGMAVLSNAKLAHGSNHMKNCKCLLGARVVENLSGIKVQEAWTGPFMVSDSRNKLYGKRYPPLLTDFVWRLVHLRRDGPPCKRLNENKVSTVGDFLFLHSVDPQRLQKIIGASATAWKAMEDHAKTCVIDDTKIYMYHDSSEHNITAVFDVVGRLKGLIRDSQCIPLNRLAEAEKDHGREILCSAFKHREGIKTFHGSENQEGMVNFLNSETTLPHQLPYQAGYAVTYTSIQESVPSHNLSIPENTDPRDRTESDTSFQIVSSTRPSDNANNALMHKVPDQAGYAATNASIQESFLSNSAFAKNVNHHEPTGPGTSSYQGIASPIRPSGSNADNITRDQQEDSSVAKFDFSEIYYFLGLSPEGNDLSQTLGDESHSHEQSNAGSILFVRAEDVRRWVFRARMRVSVMASKQGEMHASKRQRI